MENNYTDDEWVEIRGTLTMSSTIATILNYRRMYAIPSRHQELFKQSLLDNILKEGQQESVICKIFKELYGALFEDLAHIPLFINIYPSIVHWRLMHGK
jgi:hypothetical protein